MRLRAGKRDSSGADDLRRIAVAALAAALENGRSPAPEPEKRKLTGVRAVATGAVLYVAGRAAVKGYEAVREELAEDDEYEYEDEDGEP